MQEILDEIDRTATRCMDTANAIRVALDSLGLGGLFGIAAMVTGTSLHTARANLSGLQDPLSTEPPNSVSNAQTAPRRSQPLDVLRETLTKAEHPLVRAAYEANDVLSQIETSTLPKIDVLVEEYPDARLSSHHEELVRLVERPREAARMALKAYTELSKKESTTTTNILEQLDPENVFKLLNIAAGPGREVILGLFVGSAVLPEMGVQLRQAVNRLRARLAVDAAKMRASLHAIRPNSSPDPQRKEETKPRHSRSPMTRAVRIFYSYAREDEAYVRKLEGHLASLRREGSVKTWGRHDIRAGEDWRSRVDTEIERADVVLLLLSGDFLASDACYEFELGRTRERFERNELHVVPILLRPVDAGTLWFTRLDALPRGGQAIASSADQDDAWRGVVNEIRRVVGQIARE